MLIKVVQSARLASWLAILMVTGVLMSCAYSGSPVLSLKEAVIDPTVAGNYTVKYMGKTFVPDKGPLVPTEFQIFIKQNQYLIVEGERLIYLATLHKLNDQAKIAQIRQVGEKEPLYFYLILRRSASGFELGQIRCDVAKSGDAIPPACDISNKHELLRLAKQTASNFYDDPEGYFVAERND